MDNIADVVEGPHPRGEGCEVGLQPQPHIHKDLKRVVELASASMLRLARHHGVARDDTCLFEPPHARRCRIG